MNIRSPRFEQALRRQVRREIRSSRLLRRKRRAGIFHRNLPGEWLLRLFMVLWAARLLSAVGAARENPALPLAVVALWFFGEVGVQVHRLRTTLYASPALLVLYHLPLTDGAILRVQWRDWWHRAFRSLVWYVPFALALLPPAEWLGWGSLVALGLLGTQGLGARALAVHFEAWMPRGRAALFLIGFAAAVTLGCAAAWSDLPLDGIVEATAWLPVLGWLNHVYLRGWLGGDAMAWLLLLPVAMAFWTLPWSWERLGRRYRLPEPIVASPLLPVGEDEPVGETDGLSAGLDRGVTALADRIRGRGFLRSNQWWLTAGWYERLAGRLLTERERLLVELLLGIPPDWTVSYWKGLRRAAIALVLVVLLGHYGGWVLLLALVLGVPIALPFVGGSWLGLQAHSIGGVTVPAFALLPVSFLEVTRVLMKLAALRFLLGLPVLVVLATAASWQWSVPPTQMAVAFFKVTGAAVAILPVCALLPVSAASNDTQRIRWRWLPGLLLLMVLIAGAGTALFLRSGLGNALACLGVLSATSWALRWSYGRAWARGRIDLTSSSGSEH